MMHVLISLNDHHERALVVLVHHLGRDELLDVVNGDFALAGRLRAENGELALRDAHLEVRLHAFRVVDVVAELLHENLVVCFGSLLRGRGRRPRYSH